MGQNLVDVHVNAYAASAGDQIHRELIVPASGNDFVRRLANSPGNGPIQSSHFQIGERGGLLDHRYRPDQHHAVLPETVPRHSGSPNSAQRLNPEQGSVIKFHLTQKIMFDSHGAPPDWEFYAFNFCRISVFYGFVQLILRSQKGGLP